MAAHDGMKKLSPAHPDASHKPGFSGKASVSKGKFGGDKGPASPKKRIGSNRGKV